MTNIAVELIFGKCVGLTKALIVSWKANNALNDRLSLASISTDSTLFHSSDWKGVQMNTAIVFKIV